MFEHLTSLLLVKLGNFAVFMYALQILATLSMHVWAPQSPSVVFSTTSNMLIVARCCTMILTLTDCVRQTYFADWFCVKFHHFFSALLIATFCVLDTVDAIEFFKHQFAIGFVFAKTILILCNFIVYIAILLSSAQLVGALHKGLDSLAVDYAALLNAVDLIGVWKQRHQCTVLFFLAFQYSLLCAQHAVHVWLVKNKWPVRWAADESTQRALEAVTIARCICLPLSIGLCAGAWHVRFRKSRFAVGTRFFLMYVFIMIPFGQLFATCFSW